MSVSWISSGTVVLHRRHPSFGLAITRRTFKIGGHGRRCSVRPTQMVWAIDPWSVSPQEVDQVAAQLFAASLFPYLGFLSFLGKKDTACPRLALNGFRFLLIFVFATIPAGIYAKVHFGHILADVDWLHGSAESLLTVTNLLVALGFRSRVSSVSSDASNSQDVLLSPPSVTAAALCLSSIAILLHPEPWNALSLPTWVIHVSSVIEWVVSMRYIWDYAKITGNEAWKGLTWAMVPLHTSGLCACTYHLFYNAPELNALVATQAGLTLFGNACLWLAAYRIFRQAPATGDGEHSTSPQASQNESIGGFLGQLLLVSTVASVGIKYALPFTELPFHPIPALAVALIGVPTAINVSYWLQLSQGGNPRNL